MFDIRHSKKSLLVVGSMKKVVGPIPECYRALQTDRIIQLNNLKMD